MNQESSNITKQEWGMEVIWANKENYCGKILVFEQKDSSMPLHFHKTTAKTWFVNAGAFSVTWIDTQDGKAYSKELPEGSSFHVNPLTPVKLQSLQNNSAMAECANADSNTDCYKLG